MNKKNSKNNITVPDAFADMEKWESSRRSFLRAALVAGAASQLSWFTSCSAELEEANDYLTAEQSTTLKQLLMIIFPADGNGPSADDLNSFGYVLWNLSNDYNKTEENDFIISGIDWVNDTSLDLHDQPFYELDQTKQETLVEYFVELNEGRPWMSVMVTFVFESLVLDPIYGGNVNEAGWNWLDHKAGMPRPTETSRLESFIEKYKSQDV